VKDVVFETVRLVARRWRPDDGEAVFRVYSDAEAMRWVGDGSAISREDCARWLDVTQQNYARRGYGMFLLESRGDASLVGCAGLVHPGGQPEAEVKYALLRSHWGRGLASEAVRALLDWGLVTHGLRHVVATTAPENTASHRVLLKCGLRRTTLRDNGDGSFTQCFAWDAPASSPPP
jgi:ribosomal-protein-alanine N-acetyltransferase